MDPTSLYIGGGAMAAAFLTLLFFTYEVGFRNGVAIKQDLKTLKEQLQQSENAKNASFSNFDLLNDSNKKLRTENEVLKNDNAALLVQLEEQAKTALKPTRRKKP